MEEKYLNDPLQVIREFSNQPDHRPPAREAIDVAAGIITTKYRGEHFEGAGTRDALGISMDLIYNPELSVGSVEALIAMFLEEHPAIPKHWVKNTEIMRTITSMQVEVALGILRAQRLHQAHGGGNPFIERRIERFTDLLNRLQQKGGQVGEGGGGMLR